MTYTRQVGLLCPIESIDHANQAAAQLTGNPADVDTFDAMRTVSKDGQIYAYAHGGFREETFAQLPALSDALGGIFFESGGDFWGWIEREGYERDEQDNQPTGEEV